MAWKMRKTYCNAHMEFVDVSAISDSVPSTLDNQSFADISLLRDSTFTPMYNMADISLNNFVLDGSKSLVDGNSKIAFYSKQQSSNNCYFDVNPKITIAFTKNHTSSGITLYFGFDYPSEVKLYWYSLDGTLLHTQVFNPDAIYYTCKAQISNYGKIVVEFIKTRFPRSYVSLQYIKYGILLNWGSDKIINANVLEEIDITSNTLSINTANISILDANNDFDIANDDGAWRSVQKTQEITLTEYVDDEEISMGTFFLDDSSFSGNVASFTLIDTIGLMAQYTYYNGRIYDNEKVGVILEDIFNTANIDKYTIDSDIYDIEVSGWLEVQSCREALQMVCFCIGATADDSRDNVVKIKYADKYAKHLINTDRKFDGSSSVNLDDYVSSVSIGYSTYQLATKDTEIFNGTLPVGDTKITFKNPYSATSIVASVGTLKEVATNYLIISNTAEQNCTITGKQYEQIKFSYVLNGDIDASETDNVVEHNGCTLVNTRLLPSVSKHLLNYYKLRKSVSIEYVLENEMVGEWVDIMTKDGYYALSLVESQNINLTSGFISSASCRGYSKVNTADIFTGTELYTNNNLNGEGVLI